MTTEAAERLARLCNTGEVEIAPPAAERAESLLPAKLIHDDEIIILLIRPSLLFVPLASLGSIAVIALISFALAYMARVQWLGWVGWSDTQAFGLGVGLAALRLGWQWAEWICRVYVLTDRRIICRAGVLRVAVFHTDLKNIQHITVFRRVRERLFGLGTIGFATAGSDVFETYWTMISRPFSVHRVVSEAIRKYGRRGD